MKKERMTGGAYRRVSLFFLCLGALGALVAVVSTQLGPPNELEVPPELPRPQRHLDCALEPDQLPLLEELPFEATEGEFMQLSPLPDDTWLTGIQRGFLESGSQADLFAARVYCYSDDELSARDFDEKEALALSVVPDPQASILDLSPRVGTDSFAVIWEDNLGRGRVGLFARDGNALVQGDYITSRSDVPQEIAATLALLMLGSLQ